MLDEIVPMPNLGRVKVVSAESLGGTIQPWVAKTFVVCANA